MTSSHSCKSSIAHAQCPRLAFLACINAPISWKKAQLSTDVVWCGWTFSFAFETLHLSQAKLAKLRQQLHALCSSRKVQRKLLEATLGLLMWATSTCPHLRPYMAPLYRDLRSAAGALKLIHPRILLMYSCCCCCPVGLWRFLAALPRKKAYVSDSCGCWCDTLF